MGVFQQQCKTELKCDGWVRRYETHWNKRGKRMKWQRETVQNHKWAWWKSSSLKLQSRRHLYCHAAAVSIWCPSSQGLSVSGGSRVPLRSLHLAREIKSKRNQCPYFVPHGFFHAQDWARPAFHQPPVSNSAPRSPKEAKFTLAQHSWVIQPKLIFNLHQNVLLLQRLFQGFPHHQLSRQINSAPHFHFSFHCRGEAVRS